VSRFLLIAAAFLPSLAVAQASGELSTDFQLLSNEQLCALRDSPEAMSELKDREAFSRRELRAIKQLEIRRKISEATLHCILGEPKQKFPREGLRFASRREYYAAYLYSPEDSDRTIVLIQREDDEVFVGNSFTLDDGAPIPFYLSPSYTQSERGRANNYDWMRCVGRGSRCTRPMYESIGIPAFPYSPSGSERAIVDYEGEPF
jgi:hypothetical protein